MIHRTKILAGALVSCAFALAALDQSASAAGWAASHPRRMEVNNRLANQHHRINQARHLHNDAHFIRRQERFMLSQNHGHIATSEQWTLNQVENGVSKEIGQ